MAKLIQWAPEVCGRIDYLNRAKQKAETSRNEALNTKKSLIADIAALGPDEVKKKERLMCDYFECDRQIDQLRYTIKECIAGISQAIDKAHQPELFGKNPRSGIKVDDAEDDGDDDEDQDDVKLKAPAAKTRQLELKAPRMAQ